MAGIHDRRHGGFRWRSLVVVDGNSPRVWRTVGNWFWTAAAIVFMATLLLLVGLSIGKARGYAAGYDQGFYHADETINSRGGMSVETRQQAQQALREFQRARLHK